MKNSSLIIPSAICFFLMAGCISTTTGSITEPEGDNKEAADLNYQLGARYYQQGSFNLALDRLLLATKFDPKMGKAYSALALTYEALDNQRLARDAYENAVRAEPRNFEIQNTYAVYLCRQEDYGQAQKYFDKAGSHPENDDAEVTLTNAGVCMGQKPDLAAAERYFRLALDHKQNHGEALLQLCLLKFQQEDYLGARAFLQRYISSAIPTAGVLYLASMIEDKLGNDRGKADYEDQLIREFPTSPEARKVLGAEQ